MDFMLMMKFPFRIFPFLISMVPDEMSTVPIWVLEGSLAVQFIVLGASILKVPDTVSRPTSLSTVVSIGVWA